MSQSKTPLRCKLYSSIGSFVLFDAHVRNVSNLNFSIYWTFAISSCMEFPSGILATLTLDVIGRRWMIAGSVFFSGVFMILCVFLKGHPTYIYQDLCHSVLFLQMIAWP